ncbi:MAG TPA: AraC family transcriptional regulator ligand-binding domain-containing protein [Noviherbaspirillum sp.]
MTVPSQWLEPAFHPTYARLLCMLLRKGGIEPSRLLAGTGLTWAELVRAEQDIDFVRMRRLVHAALQLSGSPALGMELGAAVPVAAHGQVGYAAVASRDVRHAFDIVVRYSKLRSNALSFRLIENGTTCYLQVRELFDLGDVRVHVLEAVLLVVVQLLETLLGQPLEEAQYLLPYAEPGWGDAYRRRLGDSLRFSANCMAIGLPQSLLDTPCVTSDPAAYAAARQACEEALAQLRQQYSIVQQVRRRLLAGDSQFPTCDAMAEELHMSARTLMRKLKQHGASYQGLLDEVRKERAQWYLRHTNYPMESIAERLGYLDTTNFSRTFRRWFGISPSAYRQSAAGSEGQPAQPDGRA